MKRIFALLLATLLLFSVPASAAGPERLDLYYACFYDAHKLASILGRTPEFDSILFELFITTDDVNCYFSRTVWDDGKPDPSGLLPCAYADGEKGGFTLTFDNGEVYNGRFEDEYGLWLDFGAGYTYFHRVKDLDFLNEVKKEL